MTYNRYSVPQDVMGARLQEERGLTFISSHDDPRISAGAGTAALELLQDAGPINVFIVPIGGGGGLRGTKTGSVA